MILRFKNIICKKRTYHKDKVNVKVIVGLGNPGEQHGENRHNVGFMICEEILKKLGNPKIKLKFNGEISETNYKNKEILIVKPLTYMNESGKCIKEIVSNYSVSLDNLLVIHDDLDLDFIKIKFKRGGDPAGHKGVTSIIEKLKDNNFCRLRFGIGRPPEGIDPVEYVLEDFMEKEFKLIKENKENIAKAILNYIEFDIKYVMSKYN